MVTARDVAKLAGVNQSTVSRVFAGYKQLSRQTIEKVLKVAKQLGYVPNTPAQVLKTSRTNTIIVHIPVPSETVFSDPFIVRFLTGVNRKAADMGFSVLLTHQENGEQNPVNLIKAKRADGIILASPKANDPLLKSVIKAKIPCVTGRVDEKLSSKCCSVDVDNKEIGYEAVNYFFRQGHKRIAIIVQPEDFIVSKDFIKGAKTAYKENNISVRNILLRHTNITFKSAYDITRKLLYAQNPPDAIIATTEITSFGMLRAMENSRISIPALAVYSPLLKDMYPDISIIDTPAEQLGEQMCLALIDIIRTGERKSRLEFIHSKIISVEEKKL